LRQSPAVEAFRCLGADCEDSCCGDWGVSIDRQTYAKYQACGDTEMQSKLQRFIALNPIPSNDEDFARIALVENRCPFLAESLCSIQLKLGESYLSNACAAYPRAAVVIDGVEERSLHLSCPEAARLVLLNPGPSETGCAPATDEIRIAGAAILDSRESPDFHELRSLCLKILNRRNIPRSQRLAVLARLADDFNTLLRRGASACDIRQFIAHREDLRAFDAAPAPANLPLQLEAVLDLIVARISSDFTARRFLDCYREFMQGLKWGPESTMEELHTRYQESAARHYASFDRQHAYVLDNFLINYATRTVFPYGHRELDGKLQIRYVENAIVRQYLLLAAHYATIQTLLIGMAGFHREAFGTEHVVRLVQSYAKAFLHSTSYPAKALEILASHGIRQAPDAALLTEI
jgi:lysine-N-methylase